MQNRAISAQDVLDVHPRFAIFDDAKRKSLTGFFRPPSLFVQDGKSLVISDVSELARAFIEKIATGLSVEEAAQALGVDVKNLLKEAEELRTLFPGALRLPNLDPLLEAKMAFLASFKAQQKAEETPSQIEYHQEEIEDAEEQFNDVEMTVSHLYSLRHSSLQGRTYGGAFVDAWNPSNEGPLRVLEVGCGTGRFAKAVLKSLLQRRGTLDEVHYTLMDISPVLQAAQRDRLAEFSSQCDFVLGDAQRIHGLPTGPFDAVLCNEVIADFDVTPFLDVSDDVKAWLPESTKDATRVIHTGTFLFLKNVYDVLAPAGALWLTEYRRTDQSSAPVVLGNHVEYPVDEVQLLAHAQHAGMHATLTPLPQWMGFDEVKVISHATWSVLNEFLEHQKASSVPPGAYEEKAWSSICADHDVKLTPQRWTRIGDRKSFVDPGHFFCLHITLPSSGS
ncbi:MAG: class I SAM-dependent methyltransferase [Deltaproteobacteria bacterium]|nr:class I SAM-dependent methyltransferase [Deltaproteobacteria bacterium]